MKAMVLAAGFGTRLKPYTNKIPKALMPINGEPVIFRTLKMIRRTGIKEVVINLHHLAQLIRDAVGDGSRWGLCIKYSHENKILGTGGGVKNAQGLLGNKTFLIINSDILCNIDLGQVIKLHKEKHALATMVLRKDPNTDKYGTISLGPENRVQSILGEPHSPRGKKRMFCGIHVVQPKAFSYLRPEFSSIIHDFYIPALRRRKSIFGYDYSGFWADIGTVKDYKRLSVEK
ncbi:MAG: nucleotidyltransferase family protein [bacterium]